MNAERLTYLFNRYYDKTGTSEERQELMDNINEGENDPVINNLIDDVLQKTQGELHMDNDTSAAILQSILQADKNIEPAIVRPMRRFNFLRAAAAAAVIMLLSTGVFFILRNEGSKQIAKTEQQQKNDVVPGGNKAILTLANGTKIILDNAANGTLTQQGNTKIIKLDSGQLAYQSNSKVSPKGGDLEGAASFNTITTPKGGQYQIVLTDGSKVWLNAASSLRFPTSFTGKDRSVDLTGEGYFEIQPLSPKGGQGKIPFTVNVNGMQVEVLGTHFNINAYNDEAVIKTTLLEGSVKVMPPSPKGEKTLPPSTKEKYVILKPGEQAQVSPSGDGGSAGMKVQTVDVNEAVAWKNGYLSFKNADLKTIMRQVARWYGVEVAYESNIQDHFVATIPRNVSMINAFKILEETGTVHFRLEGRKVTVMK